MRGRDCIYQTVAMVTGVIFMGQRTLQSVKAHYYQLTALSAYVVWCGRYKPLIGQEDTETTTGQTQQLLIVLSATDAMWFLWHIVSVDNTNG